MYFIVSCAYSSFPEAPPSPPRISDRAIILLGQDCMCVGNPPTRAVFTVSLFYSPIYRLARPLILGEAEFRRSEPLPCQLYGYLMSVSRRPISICIASLTRGASLAGRGFAMRLPFPFPPFLLLLCL